MGYQNDQHTTDRKTLLPVQLLHRVGILLAVCAIGACVATSASNETIMDPQMTSRVPLPLVETIEAALAMPVGAHPLSSYVRYYAQHTVKKNLFIVATFVKRDSAGKIEIVDFDQLPQMFDGGCDVIKLRYAVSEKKVISLLCNGEA